MAILDNPATRIGISILLTIVLVPILLLVLPVIPLPVEIGQAFDWLFNTLWQWDFIFPVNAFITMFLIAISLEIIFIIFFISHWIFNKFTHR